MGAKSFLAGLGLGVALLGGVKVYDAYKTRHADTETRTRQRDHPPFKAQSTTAADLEQMLGTAEHTYRTDFREEPPQYAETPAEVQRLAAPQRTKAYQLFTALRTDPALRQSIGKIIEEDLKDTKTEHGGLVVYDGLALRMQKHYPTKFTGADPNDHYLDPQSRIDAMPNPDYCAEYHLHATQDDDGAYAGPSLGDLYWLQRNTGTRADACGVVITKLKDKKFNVDCYFVPPKSRDDDDFLKQVIVVDLGNYSWE
jgi:hypothetical protein